jgi:malate synthase
MVIISKDLSVSQELYDFVNSSCIKANLSTETVFNNLAVIIDEFSNDNKALLLKRDYLQQEINDFFTTNDKENKSNICSLLIRKLEELNYIKADNKNNDAVQVEVNDSEITKMAGPQLVVPADKVNMVLNAANARWHSLYDAVYFSNIIDQSQTEDERKKSVVRYCNDFLDKITRFSNNTSWNDISSFEYNIDNKELLAVSGADKLQLMEDKLIGITLADNLLTGFILENNSLKINILLDKAGINDIQIEAAITYIIDLEDASISAPENKYEGYRILKGIIDGNLECSVRGKTRTINEDTYYLDAKTLQEKTLKRTALALVRDVGPHMLADKDIITYKGEAVYEKILDCYITSLIGYRYHVAPKMHGAEEVNFTVKLFDRINQLQNLPLYSNKIGIMNEEMRTNSQLHDCIVAAKDVIFFTNTGFLDYTGSFIDLMMYQGPIAPYRKLSSKLYKTSYEAHNVNISLQLNVPQIGAGMWAAIKDMTGLLKSKEQQVKGLTDTGWSPSPSAAAIHAMAFHIHGNVRQMQKDYKANIQKINLEDLFSFPEADLADLTEMEILENLNFAVHGLIAYAEPWVRRGVGCSAVKELSGLPLMEDRATARIKAAFVRNWLLHNIVTIVQVENSIKEMAKFIDKQNENEEDYVDLYTDSLNNNDFSKADETIRAVYDVIFNPDQFSNSYVEPYFYSAYKRNKLTY